MQSSSQIMTTNKPTPNFYSPDARPVAHPTVSKHWREAWKHCLVKQAPCVLCVLLCDGGVEPVNTCLSQVCWCSEAVCAMILSHTEQSWVCHSSSVPRHKVCYEHCSNVIHWTDSVSIFYSYWWLVSSCLTVTRRVRPPNGGRLHEPPFYC